MNTTYALETIARQRMNETAAIARTASQRRQIKTRPGWHFPKVTFPTRPRVVTPHPPLPPRRIAPPYPSPRAVRRLSSPRLLSDEGENQTSAKSGRSSRAPSEPLGKRGQPGVGCR